MKIKHSEQENQGMKGERTKFYETKEDRVKETKTGEYSSKRIYQIETVKQILFIFAVAKRDKEYSVSKIYGTRFFFLQKRILFVICYIKRRKMQYVPYFASTF
jgi:hypothetical protein